MTRKLGVFFAKMKPKLKIYQIEEIEQRKLHLFREKNLLKNVHTQILLSKIDA